MIMSQCTQAPAPAARGAEKYARACVLRLYIFQFPAITVAALHLFSVLFFSVPAVFSLLKV